MSKQRYVQDSFWTDPYTETLDPSEKLLFLYFITNPLCNVAGIYEIRNNRIAYETGFDKDMVQKIKERFIKDGKLLCKNDWILLINFAKNQAPNPNVLLGMQRIINDLPDEVKALKGFESLSHFTLLNLTIPNLTIRTETKATTNKSEADAPQISEVIKLFEIVNPSVSRMYGNKTQRASCQRMLTQYGFEKIQQLVAVLQKTNTMKYAPTITTPLQLEDKMAQLLAFIRKEKENEVIL